MRFGGLIVVILKFDLCAQQIGALAQGEYRLAAAPGATLNFIEQFAAGTSRQIVDPVVKDDSAPLPVLGESKEDAHMSADAQQKVPIALVVLHHEFAEGVVAVKLKFVVSRAEAGPLQNLLDDLRRRGVEKNPVVPRQCKGVEDRVEQHNIGMATDSLPHIGDFTHHPVKW